MSGTPLSKVPDTFRTTDTLLDPSNPPQPESNEQGRCKVLLGSFDGREGLRRSMVFENLAVPSSSLSRYSDARSNQRMIGMMARHVAVKSGR